MKGKHTHSCILCIIALLMCNALKAAVDDRYTLVKDTSELANGDEFIIVDKVLTQTVGLFKTTRFVGCPVTLEGNDAVISDSNTTIFVLEKEGKNSYIKTQSEGKYLSGNKNKDKNMLTSSNSSPDRDLCNVTFNFESNHNVKIEIGNKDYKYFWCNNKNDGTYIWKIYDSKDRSDTYIYKKASSAESVDITLDGRNSIADNAAKLKGYDGKTIDKITLGRTFTDDGGWYTLCLPFALTADDIKTTFKDALFNEFEKVSVNAQGVAQLKFKKVTETQAGVPYMVLPRNGNTVENPVFTDKTIEKTTPKTITRTCKASDGEQLSYQFVGVYDPKEVSGENNVRFVGGNQGTELLIPDGKGTMKGLRAYFVFPNNTNGNITLAKLNVEDDSTTGINTVLRSEANVTDANSSAIYTLSGQKVQKKNNSLIPGMYIQNGKKFIVK